MKEQFLDLGMQPIANGFLTEEEVDSEYFFHLRAGFNTDTFLVSLMNFVDLDLMFNDTYAYRGSMSKTMRDHFEDASRIFNKEFNPASILEIGSNDGVFIKNFSKEISSAVEPCGNFSNLTNNLGYKTYNSFWNRRISEKIVKETGKKDLVFSANCMCHIPDIQEAFNSVSYVLNDEGVFIFEDPSLLQMIERVSYDQIYDEHAHIFSILSLSRLLENCDMEIFKVEKLSVHGGSHRVYACKKSKRKIDQSVFDTLDRERNIGLDKLETYQKFANDVMISRDKLVKELKIAKSAGKKIISYGATSKSTTVFNYCKIGPDIIDYIIDTTPEKQEKLSPGMHIPIVSPEIGFDKSVDIAFLGAWNFSKEIREKENEFIRRGGKFISHIKI